MSICIHNVVEGIYMYLYSLLHSYNLYHIAMYIIIIYVTGYACKNPPYARILHISTKQL